MVKKAFLIVNLLFSIALIWHVRQNRREEIFWYDCYELSTEIQQAVMKQDAFIHDIAEVFGQQVYHASLKEFIDIGEEHLNAHEFQASATSQDHDIWSGAVKEFIEEIRKRGERIGDDAEVSAFACLSPKNRAVYGLFFHGKDGLVSDFQILASSRN